MANGSFGYTNFDMNKNPAKHICSVDRTANFGVTDVSVGVRNCFVRNGSSHIDKFVIPEEGHAPFEPWYWLNNDEVGTLG